MEGVVVLVVVDHCGGRVRGGGDVVVMLCSVDAKFICRLKFDVLNE